MKMKKIFSIEAFQKNESVGYPNENFSLKKSLDTDPNGHQFFKLNT